MNPNTKVKVEDLLNHLKKLKEERDKLGGRISTVMKMLDNVPLGRYDNGTISAMREQKINVKSYTRRSYRVIRTH